MGLNARDKADVCREEREREKKKDKPQVEEKRREEKKIEREKHWFCNNQMYESNVLGGAQLKTRWTNTGSMSRGVGWEQKIYFRLILSLNHLFFFSFEFHHHHHHLHRDPIDHHLFA